MFKWLKSFFINRKSKNNIETSIFDQKLKNTFVSNKLDDSFLYLLEQNLIKADIGLSSTEKLLNSLKQHKFPNNITFDDLKNFLKEQIIKDLKIYTGEITIDKKPYVILFNGVNGSGKTTSLGKLAHYFSKQNYKVLIAACDTYRAAAVAQLKTWSERIGCKFLQSDKEGGDPSALAYKALQLAKQENYDILLIDTAGRLQSKINLMEQLAKMTRVLKKIDQDVPHLSLLVIDGTTGQNALKQLEIFKEYSVINGLIVTKLDGTTKGGIIIPMVQKFQIPVYYVGTGEGIEDIEALDYNKYVNNLLQ